MGEVVDVGEEGDEVGAEEDMQIIKVYFPKSFIVQNFFSVQHMLAFIPYIVFISFSENGGYSNWSPGGGRGGYGGYRGLLTYPVWLAMSSCNFCMGTFNQFNY